jgi:DNA-binding transcriptional regulator YiaG
MLPIIVTREQTDPMKKDKGFSPAGLEIIAALTEFSEALKSGEPEKKLTIRTVRLDLEPAPYTANDVKRTRELLNTSQVVFARLLGVSVKTVRCWEQGDREPSPMACRFMDEINHSPDHWKARLNEAVKTKDRGSV